ncbi:Protein-L-isoaspartate O-methyltransferase [Sinosporangium album]|uniref:Protein-L-isoaspartate O-methyltransferase n=1 Tax=Sinosporangium album TaxID=504805 RepID=A0A1G7SJQ7_9ACTN|nr:methyltransferase domain-containing protein [Sinosporangium album]SDG23297.1 Protein-L-isoaspartate O-methyltransferase [Sinosporangium album]
MTETPTWLRQMAASGEVDAEWAAIFRRLPRHLFLPDRMWPFTGYPARSAVVDRGVDPVMWRRWADSDTAMVTQWDDGRHRGREAGRFPTSSGSRPSLVARMLAALDVRPGHRVLDVGAGTGWTAALLALRAGAEGVVAVEVDPGVAEAARARLRAVGLKPPVVTGDGDAGWPAGAPYDRVQAGFAVLRVPGAWIRQTRPGGLIVLPWCTGFTVGGGLVLLRVGDGGTATGRFFHPVGFMVSRSQRCAAPPGGEPLPPPGAAESTTRVPHGDLLGGRYGTAAFVVGTLVPEAVHTASEWSDGLLRVCFHSLRCGSRAVVFFCPLGGCDGCEQRVVQWGDRRVWDEVERAYTWWTGRGRPELTRFGLSASADGRGQSVWLDRPDRPVAL